MATVTICDVCGDNCRTERKHIEILINGVIFADTTIDVCDWCWGGLGSKLKNIIATQGLNDIKSAMK